MEIQQPGLALIQVMDGPVPPGDMAGTNCHSFALAPELWQ